ncbi:MAG TPA: mannose-6-phosphate isomerase [Clostridiaceae bacterium]|jgi:mannose-6-phosphate isomerase|uniref:type I phosphomannose isomerase catalytic subunit n=1 Tax=Clostridium tyrobutyricum TaxID=1519 RepID=UPI000E93B87E|nr:type I phosphomannose isomerase catalytic subunit [Clostridium tyrobutyricum]HBF76713.1 mannose-6-phosphate isomerase [Clostridiaceae bacterium]HBG38616.1 mannose-6-phosphate isomerase [Clostridiaceae bacterium]HBX48785.1 mannose-6-phosphate isomerase [Clostridiaceae bacterium]HCL50705.1 mannose-6-phosphate isomerase [Clostridiaceae bacterium]
MEPLFFDPIYKSIIWGGRNLERIFNRSLPEGKVAESWEISNHGKDNSIITNGEFKGKSLNELLNKFGSKLVGKKCSSERFPLLIKLIDANDKLSVQVHPDNEYAKIHDNDLGKTEMWYIIDAKPNAKLICGVKSGTTKKQFEEAIKNNTLNEYLNYVDVKKGDTIFIPSGTVHAILDGIVIAEIQQNSDTTYRVYDWGRVGKDGKPRELHVEKALDVINFEYKGSVEKVSTKKEEGFEHTSLINCKFFNVDKIHVFNSYKDKTDGSTFFAYTCVEGNGKLKYKDNYFDIKGGTSFLIPADNLEFEIAGNLQLLKSYI